MLTVNATLVNKEGIGKLKNENLLKKRSKGW